MSDITVLHHGYKINLRVGAIVQRGSEILVCRNRGASWWYLPGGRVKVGESSVEALRRELREEIGESFEIVRPVVCGENFFTFEESAFHEICFYYLATWTGAALMPAAPEANEEFKWIETAAIESLELKPVFMKAFAARPPTSLQLVVQREERKP